ncbi:hypothetical protein EZS27_029969 [termite gut metagenome]|uniref:Uncharacterized protein n=1 Tax=termite gut metagenome TaxID=433724 RepID=A0A5J4QF97_9ZZZZ
MAVRRWNETLSTPVGEAFGNIDFMRDLPSVLGLGCYLVKDDRTRRKLDPTNHYKFQDGSPAALNGSMGQYMWCWNAHYYSFWKEGNYLYEAVSPNPIDRGECYRVPAGGVSALGAGVMDRTNNLLCSLISDEVRYRGGNNNAAYDDTYRTFLGKAATNIVYSTFSTYARARGVGWDANWYVGQAVPIYLIRIILGTRNSQAPVSPDKDVNGLYQGGLGNGVTTLSSDEWNTYNGSCPIIPTAAGVEFGDGTGEVPYNIPGAEGTFKTVQIPIFFGLKHSFGHLWKIIRGIQINVGAEKTEVYVAPSLYSGFDHTTIAADLIKTVEIPHVDSYIKKISMNKLCGLPTETGASASTYYCDQLWSNTSQGLRCRLSGARASTGAAAGAGASAADYPWPAATTDVSSPLCYFEEDPVMS